MKEFSRPVYFFQSRRLFFRHSQNWTAKIFCRVFRSNPQRSSVLHSFFTTRVRISIAMISTFKHSAVSACVTCFKPAGDRGRAGGAPAVPEGGLPGGFFHKALRRIAANSGVAASSERSSPQGGTEPPADAIAASQKLEGSGFSDLGSKVDGLLHAPRDLHSQECGFAVRNSPPKRGVRASESIHEAMRPGWLARAAFICG